MKIFKTLIFIAFVIGLFIPKNTLSQTAGTLSFNVTTTFTGGSWGNRSCFVVWIENSSGTFVKTRIHYGYEDDHFLQWLSKTPGASDVDAITGSTKTSTPFVYPAITWTGNDLTGSAPYNLLPDGTYTVGMELAWGSSKTAGVGRQFYYVSFTKGPSPQTVTPANQTNFTNMTLQWTPSVAVPITITTSSLSSGSYCNGASVSVPFTIGTQTVGGSNVWTAQLSNASGSFASPVSIGTLTGTTAGTISATIPAGTPNGTGYRIRVVASQPVSTGTDNGTNITIASPPTTPTVGTITQPTCVLATGSVVLSALPSTGTWTLTRTPGGTITTGTGTSTTISGLATGTYTYTVTSVCISASSANIVINAPPTTPVAPVVGSITQPTCALTTGSVVLNGLPSTGSWTINPGNITGTGISKPITGLAPGTFNFTVTNAAACTSPASANVVINTPPSVPTAPALGNITHPSCALSTGSVVLNGLPATGSWTINPGSITGTGTSTTLSGLAPGTFNYTVTNAAACTSAASVNVVINTPPSAPTAPALGTITQPSCVLPTGSIILSGLPATGSWTINPGNITGTGTSTTLSGLAPGTFNYTVTNASACTSVASANVVINTPPSAPTAPAIGNITQASCALPTGSVVLNGLPATGSWTINPGSITGTGTSTTLSGLAPGTFNYTVTNAAACISAASANVVINTPPSAPTAPAIGNITQASCALPTGSVVLNGLPATGSWTINPGSITGTGTSTTLSGLAPGTFNYTVTNAAACISAASSNVVINTPPSAPTAPALGAITQPSCVLATGSVVLNGLPATGSWTINPGSITGTGTSTTLSGLSAGTFNYTVTNAAACTSVTSANVVINTPPSAPSAPTVGTITQPTCTLATGSVVLNGLPATGSWTINPGGITGTGITKTITGLAAGTFTYSVTNAAACTSVTSANVVINTPPSAPTAPTVGTITQPSCTLATGSVVLNGLPATGNWTINPGGITGTGLTKTITGLAAGTFTYSVTNASACTSVTSANVVINTPPSAPSAPSVGTITQPSCALATGSVVLNGLPATGNWTINPGGITGTGITKTITGLTAGTITYTVTNSSACTSVASANITISNQPVTPVVTNQTSSILTGGTFTVTPVGVPAGTTYTWTAPTYTGGATGGSIQTIPQTNINGSLTIPSGTGTAIYTVTPFSGACVGATFTVTVTISSSCVPVSIGTQPADNSMCLSSGNASFTVEATGTSPFLYQWQYYNGSSWANVTNVTPNGALYTNTNSAELNIAGIATAGNYQYRCNINNCSGANSATSTVGILTVNAQTTSPSIVSITQPSCTEATGSVVLNGLPATGTWTINPGVITGTGSSTVISGLVSGTYSYSVTNASSCSSLASADITINTQPITATAPTVGSITQPTCAISTGSVVLNDLPSTGTWTINPGNITGTGSSKILTGLATGTFTYTVTNASACTSDASANVVIDNQPIAALIPSVGTITQPTCSLATGSVVLNNLPSTGTWIINPGNITGTGSNTTISGLTTGTYSYTVTNASACISLASDNVVINTQPASIAAPIMGNITQPTCAIATGSVIVNELPATGYWTINPGNITGTGTSTTITGLVPGTYNYTVTNSTGCTSVPSANVVINTQLSAPSAPIAGNILQPTCAVSTGSVILNGLPSTGYWTINPGNIAGTGTSVTITGLNTGTYNYTVTNALSCISVASENIVINTQPAAINAPVPGTISQPTCAVSTGSVTLNGLPSTGYWTINPGSISGTGTNTTITGLVAGSYSYTVTNALACTSLASANIIINTQPTTPATPTIGTITQPSCNSATGSVVINGLPASGNWTINPGNITGTGTTATIPMLTAGTYSYSVTNASTCTSIASANIIINQQPSTPQAPVISTITQPSCVLATGSVVLNNLPANGYWIINPGNIAGTGTSLTLTGLIAGTYSYIVTNATSCSSVLSANVVINIQPTIPATPTVGSITQPTCSDNFGSVVLNGLPSGNWTINPGNIAGTGTSTTLTGILSGTYNYTVSNSSACTSVATANVVINNSPTPTIAPIVGTITQPSCAISTGNVILSGLPVSGYWMINPGNISGTGTDITLTGLVAGTYNYTVTNASGCTSFASSDVVINPQPTTPPTPTVTLIGNNLHSNAAYGNQWFNQNGLINGETGQDYYVLFNGIYKVVVTLNGCSSIPSNAIQITGLGIESYNKNDKINMYPNPVNNQLILELKGNTDNTNFEILNSIGQIIFKGMLLEKTMVETSGYAPGLYIVRFGNGKSFDYKKFIKE